MTTLMQGMMQCAAAYSWDDLLYFRAQCLKERRGDDCYIVPLHGLEAEILRRCKVGEAPSPLPDDVAMLLMEVTSNGET